MGFYFSILLILILLSFGRYSRVKSILVFCIFLLMIALKGEVGPDYFGYLSRYENFDQIGSFLKSKGEFGWYLIEYFTHVNHWDYQMYTVFAGLIGVSFFIKAQNKIQNVSFAVLMFQLLFVQLGLSGLRQFISVNIIVYTVTIYLLDNRQPLYKFFIFTFLAASFHISALTLIFLLPFLKKLSTKHVIFIILVSVIGFSSDILSQNIDKYDSRYLEGSRSSLGAWIRFSITAFAILIGLNRSNKKNFFLGISFLVFGLIIGSINTIALHRFNYYLWPLSCVLLIQNYNLGLIKKRKLKQVILISIVYAFIWFNFSQYSDSVIPYKFFFE